MSSQMMFPFMFRGEHHYSTDNIDFNNIEESGMYTCIRGTNLTWKNYPEGSADGVLIVYRADNKTGDIKYIVQEFTDYNSKIYRRIRWGTSWKNWMKITTTN